VRGLPQKQWKPCTVVLLDRCVVRQNFISSYSPTAGACAYTLVRARCMWLLRDMQPCKCCVRVFYITLAEPLDVR
jgi:hypothetical protein